jgi:hypothetical protein
MNKRKFIPFKIFISNEKWSSNDTSVLRIDYLPCINLVHLISVVLTLALNSTVTHMIPDGVVSSSVLIIPLVSENKANTRENVSIHSNDTWTHNLKAFFTLSLIKHYINMRMH